MCRLSGVKLLGENEFSFILGVSARTGSWWLIPFPAPVQEHRSPVLSEDKDDAPAQVFLLGRSSCHHHTFGSFASSALK